MDRYTRIFRASRAQVDNTSIAVADYFGIRRFDDCGIDQREIVGRCEVENCTLSEMLIEVEGGWRPSPFDARFDPSTDEHWCL